MVEVIVFLGLETGRGGALWPGLVWSGHCPPLCPSTPGSTVQGTWQLECHGRGRAAPSGLPAPPQGFQRRLWGGLGWPAALGSEPQTLEVAMGHLSRVGGPGVTVAPLGRDGGLRPQVQAGDGHTPGGVLTWPLPVTPGGVLT